MMKRRTLIAAAAVLVLCVAPMRAAQAGGVAPPIPTNPNASPEAHALLRYLYSISGRYTLAGQHNYANSLSRWTDRAYDLTGKYPALFGADFGFSAGDDKDSTEGRPEMIGEIERQYRNGAVITLTWHAVRPSSDEPVSFRDNILSHLSDFEWREILTPGTDLNKRWCAQVDEIAGYLAQLRDAHIPVLWRPYHEMNGNWFWWGGRKGEQGSAALYRQEYDRFVNLHHLDNLIWVWNVNSPGAAPNGPGPYADFFPGQKYVDVLSVDIYGEFKQSYYDDLVTLAAGKPDALGEVGGVPSPEILKAQPGWTWFMVWSEIVDYNPLEVLRAVYDDARVLTRDDPAFAEPIKAMRAASAAPSPQPVTPDAAAGARTLLSLLHHVMAGHVTLSGQENAPQSVSGATARLFELTGKYPAIYAQDLGITREGGLEVGATRQAIIDEAKRQAQDHAIVSLSWNATRPTDAEPGSLRESVRGQLTDFEWNELLTPGTDLHQRWCAQVDAIAASLEQLQRAGVAVLWRPYPESNGSQFWWAGRKGIRGSAELYRQLFDRLTNVHGLRNLIWVWTAAPPGFGPGAPGMYSDFFPGLNYVDALAVDMEGGRPGFRPDFGLSLASVGKAMGLTLSGKLPPPETFLPQPGWAWFLVSAEVPNSPDEGEALKKIYSDSRVLPRSVR